MQRKVNTFKIWVFRCILWMIVGQFILGWSNSADFCLLRYQKEIDLLVICQLAINHWTWCRILNFYLVKKIFGFLWVLDALIFFDRLFTHVIKARSDIFIYDQKDYFWRVVFVLRLPIRYFFENDFLQTLYLASYSFVNLSLGESFTIDDQCAWWDFLVTNILKDPIFVESN